MPPRKLARPAVKPNPPTTPTGRRLAGTPQDRPETIAIPVAIRRYRVLFSDGATVDFLSYSDHSGIRGEMLDLHFGKRPKTEQDKRIEGIANMGQEYVYTPLPRSRSRHPENVDTSPDKLP